MKLDAWFGVEGSSEKSSASPDFRGMAAGGGAVCGGKGMPPSFPDICALFIEARVTAPTWRSVLEEEHNSRSKAWSMGPEGRLHEAHNDECVNTREMVTRSAELGHKIVASPRVLPR
jgi:hypothetical protein